ncbi:MAG: glycosyltransferase family 4 protein, partial [Hyphomicrobiales bacterium]|nr:glycosyltransferase family 4 protein [Hyphomicrobiales bacterium]
RERPDAVVTYQYWGNVFGALGAKLAGIRPVIANQSGAPMTGGLLGIASRLDRLIGSRGWYDFNIVNSSWTMDQFAGYPASYRARIRRIDHGVAPHQPNLGRAAAREKFRLPAAARLLVTSGRLTPEKNQAVLLASLERFDDLHLALAGQGEPYRSDMIEAARAVGVADRLHFVGELNRQDVGEFLAAGDIYAFPSRFETFGLAAVEAAIAGLPIVANNLGVMREVLTDATGKPAALFAPSGDAERFTTAIGTLLADRNLQADLAAAGRSLAYRYSVDAMCEAYDNLLRNGADGGP